MTALEALHTSWPNKPWRVEGLLYDQFLPNGDSYRHALEAAAAGARRVVIAGMFSKGASLRPGSVKLVWYRNVWTIEKIR